MLRLLFLLPLALLAGCASPGQSYAAKHPELTPAQRKVMSAWKLSNGDAVAGLTKEQVRLVMGRDPDQFTSFSGEEGWVWIRRKASGFANAAPSLSPEAGSSRNRESAPVASEAETVATVQERTTVYFQNGRATRVIVGEGAE